MGCIVGKESNCMRGHIEPEELCTNSSSLQNCYLEVMLPYRLKESLFPTILFPRLHPPLKESQNLLLSDKDFPVFSMSRDQLLHCCVEMFWDSGLDLSKIQGFFECVSKNYNHSVPFHNFWHAFSVMQVIYAISKRNTNFSDYLEQIEYIHLLFAAVGHDICHPGINNAYLVATKHELASKYSDMSVLENHHAQVTLEILNCSQIFPGGVSKPMSKLILEAILSTDMAKHRQCCEEFSTAMQDYNKSDGIQKQQFINYLLHCSDLGNQTLDFSIAAVWSLKIVQEFNFQVYSEEQAGIKVSEFMRIGSDIAKIKNSQVGFITSIIFPLWSTLSTHIPNIEDFPETVKKNKKRWQEVETFIV